MPGGTCTSMSSVRATGPGGGGAEPVRWTTPKWNTPSGTGSRPTCSLTTHERPSASTPVTSTRIACAFAIAPSVRSADVDGHGLPSAHRRRRRELDVVVVDFPVGEPIEHFVERDPTLESRERGAEAVVESVAEREVLTFVAVDVEAVGLGVAPLVAVRGPDEQQHRAPGRHRRAVVLDVA